MTLLRWSTSLCVSGQVSALGPYGPLVSQGRIQDLWKGGFIFIKVWGFALLILSHFS